MSTEKRSKRARKEHCKAEKINNDVERLNITRHAKGSDVNLQEC